MSMTPTPECRNCRMTRPEAWCPICGTPQHAPADPSRSFYIGAAQVSEGTFLGQMVALGDLRALRHMQVVPVAPIAV